MLAVYPASGGLGSSIVSHLLARSPQPSSSLLFVSRNPDKLNAAEESGVTLRQADYDQPETLEGVFAGAETLCLISYPSIQIEHRFKSHKRAIEAARRSGVNHVLYTSLAFAGSPESTESVAQVMQAHLLTEQYLRELQAQDESFSFTIVREGLYSESFPIYTAFYSPSSPSRTIRIPHAPAGAGRGLAWVKRDELGEATARILLSSSSEWKNRTVVLSGARDPPQPDLRVERVSVEEYAAQAQVQEGFAAYPGDGGGRHWAEKWANAWEAIERGETGTVTTTMRDVLGREPEGFEETLTEMLEK
ncbi:hypothetical protein Rhopal_000454-T1 [Rhodotorula paludigena]|uniref:NmrA-like domain-containing protein n=1 Tax=Rhodotorula paludigena TaxID=86838 RepID=A0AAV5GCP2_9BASI|nr:hypothetical protein Rhopal_000454-T1 [Rhodotorula paludigena]